MHNAQSTLSVQLKVQENEKIKYNIFTTLIETD